MGLIQPLLFMFFFGPLLKTYVAHTPGFPPGTAWIVFTPSLMLQMVLVGSFPVGMALLYEYRSGVLDRFRATPLRPLALLLGKVFSIASYVIVQSLLLVALCFTVFGMRCPWIGLAVSLVLVAMMAVTLASCSYALALRIKNEDGTSSVLNAVIMPLLLLSGTLLPITKELAPSWLYYLAQANPVAHVMNATRAVFRGDYSLDLIWPGVSIDLVMAVGSILWAANAFKRLDAG